MGDYHDPRAQITHDIAEGQVYEDTRGPEGNRERITLLYVDDQIAVLRSSYSDSGHRLNTRGEFEENVGAGRYKLLTDVENHSKNQRAFSEALALVQRVRDRHRVQGGRVHQHKAEGLQELLEELQEVVEEVELETPAERESPEMDFESISGIGAGTAENLRDAGYVTEADVAAAEDEELLNIRGVGQTVVERMREVRQ